MIPSFWVPLSRKRQNPQTRLPPSTTSTWPVT